MTSEGLLSYAVALALCDLAGRALKALAKNGGTAVRELRADRFIRN